MREASTKPSAATVLPAPVACSNQKRLAALGSSGCSASWTSSSSESSGVPVLRLLGSLVVLVVVLLAGDPDRGERRRRSAARRERRCRCRCAGPRRAARSACPTARRPGGRTARCRRPACGSSSPSRRSRPSSSDHVRRHSTDGTVAPGVELGQRGVERGAARAAGGERVGGLLALETKGSRVNVSARSSSPEEGRCAAWSATAVGSAMKAQTAIVWRRAARRLRAAQREARGPDVEPGVVQAAPRHRPPASDSH